MNDLKDERTLADFEDEIDHTVKQIRTDSFETIRQRLESLAAKFDRLEQSRIPQEDHPDTSDSIRWAQHSIGRMLQAISQRLTELNPVETPEFRAVGERTLKSLDALMLRVNNFRLGL